MENIKNLFRAGLIAGLTIINTFVIEETAKGIIPSSESLAKRPGGQIQSDFGSLSVLPDELIVKILADSIEDDFRKCTDQSMLLKKLKLAVMELQKLRLVNHKFANFLTNETIIYILKTANIASYANKINPDTGEALLHLAIRRGKYILAQILIQSGVNVNAQLETPRDPKIAKSCPVGTTPLHTAIKMGNPRVVELLIYHGADITATTTKLRQVVTPLDIAISMQNETIIRILKAAYKAKGITIPAPDEIENAPVFINIPEHN